mmetsp:Transcript_78047/g.137714  ORF Transcript_78047/g.137714 Transcript_78047/m.137714 type:complete len:102 (+) Transcript_78047:292-597(+)
MPFFWGGGSKGRGLEADSVTLGVRFGTVVKLNVDTPTMGVKECAPHLLPTTYGFRSDCGEEEQPHPANCLQLPRMTPLTRKAHARQLAVSSPFAFDGDIHT